MSKKVFNVFSILCFALVLCFIGCTELINPKTETDINLNIDLSKIIKSTRNTGETQSSASIGENPTIKVAIYDAKKYNATTNSTDNLDLITEAQAKIVNNEAKVKLNNIPVGIDAIVFAELSFSNGNSTEVMYAGNSEVFRVKASDNKVSLILKKVANSETSPDNTNTPYEKFTLFQKNSDGTEVTDVTEASISSLSEGITKVTVKDSNNSDSVWTYFVKPNNNTRFTESANYKVSVELKADKTTVVGIAAARADYFFTVNSDWTPCEFNTGYLIGNENHQFTIGLGLSSEIEIRNLKIEKLETTDTTEPSLVFDISKYAIETYLGKTDKATKIIDVSKLEGNAGYNITINTPMCHSTGTDDSYIQDVKLHLRSYATETTGANKVSFNITNNSNDFETSVMADTASDKSISWNSNATKISENNGGNFSVDFPNYKATDELIVDLITSSTSTSQNNSTSFTLSNFKVGKAEDPLFSDKIFVYKTNANDGKGDIFTKLEDSSTISINSGSQINFDVLMFNYDAWLDESNSLTYNAFDEATRFIFADTTSTIGNLTYNVSQDNDGNPIYTLQNNTDIPVTVKISLNENYEVVIEEVPQVTYAEGLTCDVQDDTVTLYISSAKGLATFGDIVNGTLTENISVRYNDTSTSRRDFSAYDPQLNINAELENDIDLNNVSWTPIGKNSTDGYKGTFDGAKHEIKGLIINSSDTNNPQGLFCSVYGGTVKNLVVQGSITSSCYTGGITGYLNGGTIENCVNNVEINNSATNGTTGGIVGYVENSTATIKNCVNMAKVVSTKSTVGGIVGATGDTSNVSISKCINMGEISALSIVAGILGLAYPITIENCINLGKVISTIEGDISSLASGIVIPSEDDVSVTVTNCINAGNVVTNNGSVGAISTSENGIYTNNYYDSTVNSSVDSSISGITGKSTSELIALTSENLSDQWSFVDGCYPLPDITETIPGGANGEIWSAVIEAATPENTSTSGGGIDGTIQYLSDLSSYYDSTNEYYSLTTGEYIFGKDLELDKPLYILSGNKVTICSNTNITITSSFSDDKLIYIERGEDNYGTLTLGSGDGVLTLKHENSTYPTIASYGELTLNNNCAITGSNYCAINVYDGNFIMNGGEIYGNKYSGSNIQSSAVNLLFTYDSIDSSSAEFYGGKIYNNETTTSGGAIAYTGDATPYIELTGIEIYNNKANISGGGIYSNTANLYVNSESRIYDNYVNGSKQGASIFVEDLTNGNYFYMDYVDAIDTPYTEDIGL